MSFEETTSYILGKTKKIWADKCRKIIKDETGIDPIHLTDDEVIKMIGEALEKTSDLEEEKI